MVWQIFKLDDKRSPLEKGDFRKNGVRIWRKWLEPGNNCRGFRYNIQISWQRGAPKKRVAILTKMAHLVKNCQRVDQNLMTLQDALLVLNGNSNNNVFINKTIKSYNSVFS